MFDKSFRYVKYISIINKKLIMLLNITMSDISILITRQLSNFTDQIENTTIR